MLPVELGVFDRHYHAPRLGFGQVTVGDEIVLYEAGECRDRHAEANRPGGEVDRNAILGARRVALCASQAAETL